MKRIATSILAAAVCLTFACAGSGKLKSAKRYECSTRLAQALKKYNAGKFESAKTILDDIKVQCAGNEAMDSAGYYLGMSLMRSKQYPEARLEFTRLVQDFPASPFFDEAQFRICYCVFKSSRPIERDQTETKEAAKLLRDFLENYPDSRFADSARVCMIAANDKLAEKEYNNARFYQKIGEKEAATVYYKAFINDYPASKFVPQAKLDLGQMLLQLSRNDEAKEVLDELIAKESQGEIVKKARELLAQLNHGG